MTADDMDAPFLTPEQRDWMEEELRYFRTGANSAGTGAPKHVSRCKRSVAVLESLLAGPLRQTARPCGGTDPAPLGSPPNGAVNGWLTEEERDAVAGIALILSRLKLYPEQVGSTKQDDIDLLWRIAEGKVRAGKA